MSFISNEQKQDIQDVVKATLESQQELIEIKLQNLLPVVSPSSLPFFTGGVGESFEDWIKRYCNLALANGWSESKKREVLPWFLQGYAELKYISLSQSELVSFDSIIKALSVKLKCSQESDFKSRKLLSRIQGSDESVIEFSQAIHRLTKQAYPEMCTETQGQLIKRLFINGLRPNIRHLVMLTNPDTVDEAEASAREIEVHQYMNLGSNAYLATPPLHLCAAAADVPMQSTSSTGKLMDNQDFQTVLLTQMEQLANKIEDLNVNRGNIRMKNIGLAQATSVSSGVISTGRLRCFKCGKAGHLRAQCQRHHSSK